MPKLITGSGNIEQNGTTTKVLGPLESTGTLTSGGNLSVTGTIYSTGDITAFSDRVLKSNVTQIQNALETVSSLMGVTYEKDGRPSLGLIAQDVQTVLPELVHKNGEHFSVAYGNIVAVLIEAVKELKSEIQVLRG